MTGSSPNGQPTVEPAIVRLSLRPLRRPYGHTPAREFGPLALKAVRRAMIEACTCRTEIDRRVERIVRWFEWGVESELIPPSVHRGFKAVAGLHKGQSKVRERPPVRPVPEAFVDAIRPHVPRQVRAMVELQRLAGMRPGEVCRLRTRNLDSTGHGWVETPASHETEPR